MGDGQKGGDGAMGREGDAGRGRRRKKVTGYFSVGLSDAADWKAAAAY